VVEIKGSRNSEVCKVRAEELGAPSREWRNREEKGSPLDPSHRRTVGSEPHRAYHGFGGSEVERTSSRYQKSRSVKIQARRNTWQNHKVGPV
jgi:hypothetical protein